MKLPAAMAVLSPDADVVISWHDEAGCCIGSEIVPAGEERVIAPLGAFFTAAMLLPDG